MARFGPPFILPKCSSSHRLAVRLKGRAMRLPPPYIPSSTHVERVLRRSKMSPLVQHSHKIIALVAAVAITVFLQGAMLAGFEHMAQAPQTVVLACSE